MKSKKILITGKSSYIGSSFKEWLQQWPEQYEIDVVSVRGEDWSRYDFSAYDTLVHVAGIAHKKEKKKDQEICFEINRDLVYEVAKKAKAEGVNQFIFLSSMSVYGLDKGTIDYETILKPKTNYGKSKLEAENLIKQMESDKFKVAIIRPPMVYGPRCKGNYPKLKSIALKTPVFPYVKNKRSMIFIDNLCEFLKLLIDNGSQGTFFPQNNEYICTSELVELIARINGKKVYLLSFLSDIISNLNFSVFNKVFGDLIYIKEMSLYQDNYEVCSFKESIYKSDR